MIPYERRSIILNELAKNPIVTLSQLCEIVGNVSESTVRRDLNFLETEGIVQLLRGGAAKLVDGSYDTPISSRIGVGVAEKEAIAETAASFVEDGECIYIDVGTTTGRMIKYLKNKKVSVVTTDIYIAEEITKTGLSCMLVGGELIKETGSLVGTVTNKILYTLVFDKAFLGIYGYDVHVGFCNPDYRESEKKNIVRQNAKQTFVLADKSKENKRSMAKAFDIGDCALITNEISEEAKEYVNYILTKGVTV